MDLRRTALEEQAAALCGERIAHVRYLEINYQNGQPEWNRYSDRFHVLDYGLELEMESGQVVSIIWDWEFAEYGITVQPGSSQVDIQNCAVYDVTAEPAWAGLLHTPITDIQVYWGRWEETSSEGFTRQEIEAALQTTRAAQPADQTNSGFGLKDLLAVMETLGATRPKTPVKRVPYPQDIVITTEPSDKIYLCAREYREEQDELFPSADQITVIFREDVAQHYHVGPHTRT